MSSHRLDVVDRHLLVALDGGHALIDTGSPVDIGRGAATTLLDARWCPPARHAAVLDTASAHLGVEVAWLLGAPTLRRAAVLLDWTAGVASFGAAARIPDDATAIAIDVALGVPVLEMMVTDAGLTTTAVLDSGAALSYVPAAAVAGRPPLRRARDFHPTIGGFDVDVYALPISVGGRAIALEAGVLPPALERVLGPACGGWILGSDFFRDRAIVVDYAGGVVLDGPGGARP